MDYGAIAEVAAAVITTVATISDMKQRARFQESLELLSLKQLEELNGKMLAAQTLSARLAILSKSVTEYTLENKRRDEKNKMLVLVIGSALAITLSIAIFINISKKKS